ncbi:hypothetical protein GCM10011571_12180 [Marinithermofilum abyssi]|uniref:Uncharacterized protein n=1 Tax=Marinithermofilum abyssi TaxID=1571185 RepID=A0A8J2VH68_9BACL|nr:hypothetical protein [Marinithermofilum abyssi]GGE12342.1 hypothetical protein GCM10011571_12180 [Marinithermofilum abyssi]
MEGMMSHLEWWFVYQESSQRWNLVSVDKNFFMGDLQLYDADTDVPQVISWEEWYQLYKYRFA